MLKGLHWNPLIDIMYGEVRLISHVSTLMHMGKNNRFFLISINPLSPNIHIQILQTGLHTFP